MREPGRRDGVAHPAAHQLVHERLDRRVGAVDRLHGADATRRRQNPGPMAPPVLFIPGFMQPAAAWAPVARAARARTDGPARPPRAHLRGPPRRDRRGGRGRAAGRLLARRPAGPARRAARPGALRGAGHGRGDRRASRTRPQRSARAEADDRLAVVDRGGADRGRRRRLGAPAAVRRPGRDARRARSARAACAQDPAELAACCAAPARACSSRSGTSCSRSSCRCWRSRAAATRATRARRRRSPTPRPRARAPDRRGRRPRAAAPAARARGDAARGVPLRTWAGRALRMPTHEEEAHSSRRRGRGPGGRGRGNHDGPRRRRAGGADPADRLPGGAGDLHRRQRQVPGASVRTSSEEIRFELSYAHLTGAVQQAHIHLGQRAVNGGISVFLCSNLGNGPAGTQACPPAPAKISGTIRPADVVGPAARASTRWSSTSSSGDPGRSGLRQRPQRDLPERRDPRAAEGLGATASSTSDGLERRSSSTPARARRRHLQRPVDGRRQRAGERRVEQLERRQPAGQLDVLGGGELQRRGDAPGAVERARQERAEPVARAPPAAPRAPP